MKEYPKRPDTKVYQICECGHPEFYHEWTNIGDGPRGQCEKCLCPKLHIEKTMTREEYGKFYLERLKEHKEK